MYISIGNYRKLHISVSTENVIIYPYKKDMSKSMYIYIYANIYVNIYILFQYLYSGCIHTYTHSYIFSPTENIWVVSGF